MLERWLSSCPELELVELDVALGARGVEPLPLSPLALRLASAEERALLAALDCIERGSIPNAIAALADADGAQPKIADLHLLYGALLLAEGRISDALEPLQRAHDAGLGEKETARTLGCAIRRLAPALRLLVRIGPAQLLPLYPGEYAAGVLLGVALWRSGDPQTALTVLREVAREHGVTEELRVLGGQLHLQLGNLEQALSSLVEPQEVTHDALDLSRCLYLALAHLQQGELQVAVRSLRPAVLYIRDVNPHTHARALLLLAELYGRAGLPLEALRHSGRVQAAELPHEMAHWLAQRETEWVEQLDALSYVDLERQAHADAVNLRIPDAEDVLKLAELQNTHPPAAPVAKLEPKEMSWLRRHQEEEQISAMQAAVARGESVRLQDPQHTQEGKEFRRSLARLRVWWEQRRPELLQSGSAALARDCSQCAHVRFDQRGSLAPAPYRLPCERLVELISWTAGVALALLLALALLRSCMYPVP